MMKTILITGGGGFVGRSVLRALDSTEHKIRSVVRREVSESDYGSRTRFRTIVTPDLFKESSAWWADVCQGVDIIIHLAWFVEPGAYVQSPKNLGCLQGTLRLAEGAAEAGVRRFIGIGTCFEYDLSEGHLSLDTPLRPTSPYSATKAATYLALSQWLPARDVEFAWCRLFYLYGEGENEQRLVAYLKAKLAAGEPAELTRGDQIRDYLDVQEAGERIAKIALATVQGPINICSGNPMTVRELAERVADQYGARDLLRFGARPEGRIEPPCIVGVPTLDF